MTNSRKTLTHAIQRYVRSYPGRQTEGYVFIEARIQDKFGAGPKSLPENLIEQAIELVEEYFQRIMRLQAIKRKNILTIPA